MNQAENPIIANVRKNLAASQITTADDRPPVLTPRQVKTTREEIHLFIEEVGKVNGYAQQIGIRNLPDAFRELAEKELVRKATMWESELLVKEGVAGILEKLGVEVISCHADINTLATCDLGITEADFVLPETGTIALLSSNQKPRSVSLLPRIHLAIIDPSKFRADLHDVFQEASNNNYLVLITGPSRTADIELTVALGVHGPKSLYAWILQDI